ncbi:MAG: adenylosuccinate synthetase [Fibrobacteres bacterium]|nr:adenylosuccinate synthetase [Fibrobacterota bacterium]
MGAIIVVDALWGDSGKGKIASYLAVREDAKICIRAGTGTNAGHSIHLENGEILKTHQLPLAGLLTSAQMMVGSGVGVDPAVFFEELERFEKFGLKERAKIDFRSPVILPEYIKREKLSGHLQKTVGSTLSGTGVCQSEFCMRTAKQAKDVEELAPYICDAAKEVNQACKEGNNVVVEGSQGTFLSLALTKDYPCCTSGNCTTTAFADDIGLNWKYITEVILVVKAVPSRIGEGPLPFELSVEEQDARGIAEFGVKTGRRRRKSDRIPMDLLKESVMLNGPTQIALTFCDHFDPEVKGKKNPTDKITELIDTIEKETNVPVTILDFGKSYNSIVEIKRC